MEPQKPLADRRIIVPESRELDLFARMLEAQGATTLRCPMVAILDLEDTAPVEAWLKRLMANQFDDLILLTGEGLRRLLAVAERMGARLEFIAALGKLRMITRGPKPVRVLRELGLTSGISADPPTTEGVIQALVTQNLQGRGIGVQLYPGNPNDRLLDFLREAGGLPDAVLPYRYASDAETVEVETAIRAMAEGKIDVIAFTSTPQVKRLQEVARERGLEAEWAAGLARTRIAAVGPVVAAALEAIGAKVAIMPADNFHLKPLVNAIGAALREEPTRPADPLPFR